MQLEISREALLRPLQLVSGALGGRPTCPSSATSCSMSAMVCCR